MEEKLATFCLGKDGKIYRVECKVEDNVILSYVDGEPGSSGKCITKPKDFIVKESNKLIISKLEDGSLSFAI